MEMDDFDAVGTGIARDVETSPIPLLKAEFEAPQSLPVYLAVVAEPVNQLQSVVFRLVPRVLEQLVESFNRWVLKTRIYASYLDFRKITRDSKSYIAIIITVVIK